MNFTTSIFINCNFDEVTLVNCTFDYCKFEGCFIKYNDLLQSLSKRPNIRWELCKNLSLECLKLGHEDEYRKYYFEEKKQVNNIIGKNSGIKAVTNIIENIMQ